VRGVVDAALGPVRHLVVPNSLHHTFLATRAAAYPEARVHAEPGLTQHVAGTAIHATLGDELDHPFFYVATRQRMT